MDGSSFFPLSSFPLTHIGRRYVLRGVLCFSRISNFVVVLLFGGCFPMRLWTITRLKFEPICLVLLVIILAPFFSIPTLCLPFVELTYFSTYAYSYKLLNKFLGRALCGVLIA